jgi:hypothetical protein
VNKSPMSSSSFIENVEKEKKLDKMPEIFFGSN